jgi:2-polyprenyl-3-methyl-5-hydroxy-6-metoxy-1,4-benzoquinol methylase
MNEGESRRLGSGEAQYQRGVNTVLKRGAERLGLVTSWAWHDDPRHLVFTLARYKFVAKMLNGLDRVLEIGCGDGFPTRLVAQSVKTVVAIDFDQQFIDDSRRQQLDRWPIRFEVHDIMAAPFPECFDAVFALDVIEHIPQTQEDHFLRNVRACIGKDGIALLGTPTLESQVYASQQSKEGHVNCKSAPDLQKALYRHFSNVFIFSMNDEVVHTGYHKMAHYLFALCCAPK